MVNLNGERDAQHPGTRMRVGSDSHPQGVVPLAVTDPTDPCNREVVGGVEFGERITDRDGNPNPEIRQGLSPGIINPECAVVFADELAKNDARVDGNVDDLPNVCLCHTLNSMVETRTFRWSDGVLRVDPTTRSDTSVVRVADSWLTVDGTAVALERHFDRFSGSLKSRDPHNDVRAFTDAVRDALPESGRWFPRIEAIENDGEMTLRLLIRVAPEPSLDVTLATAAHDPRSTPSVKGPDLAALGELRTQLGAGEAVILDDGFLAEGAWSSIVWWRNDTLHCVDPSIARLPGVTESVIRDFARHIGSTVVPARIRPEDLDGAEVWVLSALHGIRVATNWHNGPELSVEPGRVDYWRTGYANNRQVICSA